MQAFWRGFAIVALPALTVRQVASLPVYGHQRITREFEDRLRPYFEPGSGRIGRTEEDATGRRPVPASTARVIPEAATERVPQRVALDHEELVIEHRAPRPGSTAAGSAGDRELRKKK